jgi:hypothetical protein
MDRTIFSKQTLVKNALVGIIILSSIALIYHIRWFLPFLFNSVEHGVPDGQSPMIWFCVQILSNTIFLFAGYLLMRLYNKYQLKGYFDKYSLKVLDYLIISCILLATLGFVKLAFSNFYPLPLSEYNSIWGAFNLIMYFIIDTVSFKEPQTMFLLITVILWVIRQFVIKALFVKSENETFI